ncbi:MAG: aminotransferase class V-fold PLP-dependent enzyme [Planctomycetota bacterium]|jgi:kynureninase
MPLLDYRDRFPILQNTTYLINNSLGAMPGAVAERMAAYADIWARRGVRAWAEEWWSLPVEVGDLVAPLLGAPQGSVSMHTNVSVATAVFLSCLDAQGPRKKLVTTELQFPTVQYVLEGWAKEREVEIAVVPAADGIGCDQQQLLETIDKDTLAVSVSHVEFKSAFINDAEAIAHRCREVGARLLLDTFQSGGVVPIHAQEWGVDAVVGGCLKFLCGGPGNVYFYVDPAIAPEMTPKLTGWMAHPRPFGFEPMPMEHRTDAYRYLNGTPQIACLYAAPPGLEMHNEIGIPAIRANNKRLTSILHEGANERGWRTHCPADHELRGSTVAIDCPHGELVATELNARDVVVDYRPGAGIRVAPHFYNTEDEVRFALDQIAEILETKAYARHDSVGGATPT